MMLRGSLPPLLGFCYALHIPDRRCGDPQWALSPILPNHVIFATRYRKPAIAEDFRERLYEYIGGTIRSVKGHAIQIGGVEDHVHLLMNLSPARAVSDVVRDIKANASKWINELSPIDDRFEWQKGYGAFTVSYSRIGSVQRYIQNQAEHHRTKTFEEEYFEFLRLHNIEVDRG